MDELPAQVRSWDVNLYARDRPGGEFYSRLYERLLNRVEEYAQYLPNLGAGHSNFLSRLEDWIANVPDDAQKRTLLELAAALHFFSKEDFWALCQSALNGPICRWTVEHADIDLTQAGSDQLLQRELVNHTWYLPLTDGMPIREFYHINNISGGEYRPDCFTVARFGNPDLLRDYMRGRTDQAGLSRQIKRIVVVEDFVGTGAQALETLENSEGTALEFIAGLDAKVPVLFVPLIVLQSGSFRLAHILPFASNNFSFEPVLEVADADCISPQQNPDPATFAGRVATLVRATYSQVAQHTLGNGAPYSAFGMGETGGTVVLYSNTPTSTLPIIHHASQSWRPLFRRSHRVI